MKTGGGGRGEGNGSNRRGGLEKGKQKEGEEKTVGVGGKKAVTV